MSTASCVYEGSIRHRRADPRRDFSHRIALAYIDLDELPRLLGGRLVRRHPGLVRLRRQDYLGDPRLPLDRAVRDAVEEQTGHRPPGPVRMLTHPRSLGHCFNPVSFYYCLDQDGKGIEALVAEVTNTPWRERHTYVIAPRQTARPVLEGSFTKALHVSPFMAMDHTYQTRATVPGSTLSVQIESRHDGAPVFAATLALRRQELTRRSLRRLTARYPFATVRVLALIYAHAVGLRLAGARTFPHPGPVAG